MSAADVIAHLDLVPLPGEGGYYAETYRTALTLDGEQLPDEHRGDRHAGTAIYFLVTPDAFSALHRLAGDELYHFYAGDPVDLVTIDLDGTVVTRRLGTNFAAGERPQLLAPGGTWQGSALAPGGKWALLGTTMTPGFHLDDFDLGDRDELLRRYPEAREEIVRLTRLGEP